jgi:hypothetical protein
VRHLGIALSPRAWSAGETSWPARVPARDEACHPSWSLRPFDSSLHACCLAAAPSVLADQVQQEHEHRHDEQHGSCKSSEKSQRNCRRLPSTSLAVIRSSFRRHRGIDLGPDGCEPEQAGVVRRRLAHGIPTPTFCTHRLLPIDPGPLQATRRLRLASSGSQAKPSDGWSVSPRNPTHVSGRDVSRAPRRRSARAGGAPGGPAIPMPAAAAGPRASGDMRLATR